MWEFTISNNVTVAIVVLLGLFGMFKIKTNIGRLYILLSILLVLLNRVFVDMTINHWTSEGLSELIFSEHALSMHQSSIMFLGLVIYGIFIFFTIFFCAAIKGGMLIINDCSKGDPFGIVQAIIVASLAVATNTIFLGLIARFLIPTTNAFTVSSSLGLTFGGAIIIYGMFAELRDEFGAKEMNIQSY